MGLPLDEFLQALVAERGASPHTVRHYRVDVQSLLLFASNRGLSAFTLDRECVRQWAGERAGSLAPGTRNRQLSAVRTFFGWMEAHGLRCGNPTHGVRGPPKTHALPRVPTVAQVQMLIDGTAGSDFPGRRARVVLELLYGAGLRVSELAALSASDVDPRHAELRVRGKGDKDRIVFVGPPAQAALEHWLPLRLAMVRRRESRTDALLVNARDGGRLDVRSIARIVRQAGDAAGMPGLHPHALRHAYATHLIDRGADVLMVSKLLGHACVTSTQVYTRLATARLATTIREHHPRG